MSAVLWYSEHKEQYCFNPGNVSSGRLREKECFRYVLNLHPGEKTADRLCQHNSRKRKSDAHAIYDTIIRDVTGELNQCTGRLECRIKGNLYAR